MIDPDVDGPRHADMLEERFGVGILKTADGPNDTDYLVGPNLVRINSRNALIRELEAQGFSGATQPDTAPQEPTPTQSEEPTNHSQSGDVTQPVESNPTPVRDPTADTGGSGFSIPLLAVLAGVGALLWGVFG